jgi:hypothetical protein
VSTPECTNRHVFSAWFKSKRMTQWMRTCGYCGAVEHSTEQPKEHGFSKFVPPAHLKSGARGKDQ